MFIGLSLVAVILFSGMIQLINQKHVAYRKGIKKGKVKGCRELMVHISKDIDNLTLHKSLRYCNVTLAKDKEWNI